MIKTCLLPQKTFYEKISCYRETNQETGNENNNIIENNENQDLDNENLNNNDENDTLEKIESSDMAQNNVKDENNNNNINDINNNENINEIDNENLNDNVNENNNENDIENINDYENNNEEHNNNIDNNNENEIFNDNDNVNEEDDNENDNANDNENANEIVNEMDNENNEIKQEEIIKEKESKQIINEDVLVIKDELYNEYLDALFCNFLDWIFDKKISSVDETETDIDTVIRNINGLELLSALNSEIKTCEFSQKFLNIINYLITPKGNGYILLMNNNIMNYLLDLSFNYFLMKNNQNNEENINDNNNLYPSIKLSILNIFKNSLIYISEEKYANIFPLERLEIFFIWATHLLNNDENLQTKENIFEFLSDMFSSLLDQFCELYNNNLENIFLKLNISKFLYSKLFNNDNQIFSFFIFI